VSARRQGLLAKFTLKGKFMIFICEKLLLKTNIDGVVKSQISWFFVIPANAGIQQNQYVMDAPASQCGAGFSGPA